MISPEGLGFRQLVASQCAAVGLALVREAMLAGTVLGGICLFVLLMALRYNEQLDLSPELLQPTLFIALQLPWAVWKGDPVFGRGFLWTLPVARQRAAMAKVLAGALWLMLALLVTFAALSIVVLATGGSFGVSYVRLVETGTGGLTTARPVAWATPAWAWLMPFGGALILYFASSALLLGLRHPFRWLAGVVAGCGLIIVLGLNLAPDGVVEQTVERAVTTVWGGNFGFDLALTGGENTLWRVVDRPGPGHARLWPTLPAFHLWATATLAWLAVALLALGLAIRRHWER